MSKKPGSLEQAEASLKSFENDINDVIGERTPSKAPETEQQTKLSSNEIAGMNIERLRPIRKIGTNDKPIEKFRKQMEFDQEIVRFIAENKEMIGEKIEIWTKPYAGIPAEFWNVPVNRPVEGPRYLADQIKRKFYHRLVMKESDIVSSDGMGTYSGRMVADTTVPRLDAFPVRDDKQVFIKKSAF